MARRSVSAERGRWLFARDPGVDVGVVDSPGSVGAQRREPQLHDLCPCWDGRVREDRERECRLPVRGRGEIGDGGGLEEVAEVVPEGDVDMQERGPRAW